MRKKLSQLIIVLFFLLASFFVFTNKVEAACNCTNTSSCSSAGGTCKPQAQCSGTTKTGLCPCATAAECVCCIPSTATPTPTPTPGSYESGEFNCYSATSDQCRQIMHGPPPPSICCRSGGCQCEQWTLEKWEYCYVYQCCVAVDASWQGWYWTKDLCSTADSCSGGSIYLKPGICSSSGCTKGGNYKICCSNSKDGSTCPHSCSGGNTSGTCGSGCYNPGPNVLSCPTSATHTVCSGNSCVTVSGAGTNECSSNSDCVTATHKVCSGSSCVTVSGAGSNQCNSNSDCTTATHRVCSGSSCVTVSGAGTNQCNSNSDCGGGGTTCTPGACVDSCHRCASDGRSTGLDYTCSSDWCACARQYNYPPGWEASCGGGAPPAPTSCSARGGFCAYNGLCPTNKGYSNIGSTSDCPGGCCACY